MRFYPEQNVRVTGSTLTPGLRERFDPGGPSGSQIGLSVRMEPAPGLALPDPLPPGLDAAAAAGPEPGGLALSGSLAGFRALAGFWAGAGCPDAATALSQAVDAYLEAARRPRRPVVVGIVNTTPDSFSDGGRFFDAEAAVRHGLRLVTEGADWLDVGGESTRPGAREVPAEEELRRVLPVVERLAAEAGVPVSVDTRKAVVAEPCLAAGAVVVNDVSALTHDPEMAGVVAAAGATVLLMHMPGEPATMQERAVYRDVVAETAAWLRERAEAAVAAGIRPERLWIDPGFGFGKTVSQNLEILRRLREYTSIGLPLLVGTSRKSTIGSVLGGLPAGERIEGTAATVAASVLGGAAAVRVHDVREMARVVRMAWAILAGPEGADAPPARG